MPTCAICGKNLSMLGINKIRLKGGDFVCLDCVKKSRTQSDDMDKKSVDYR